MNVNLPAEQQAFINQLVETGRFASIDEVIGECVQLLKSREQLRNEIQGAIDQADQNQVVDHDSVFESLRLRSKEIQQAASTE